ncbi:SDH family Clp fold serine proteinase [Halomicronema hongdechloris]|uniref:SDH family Clp fold serine proteinase n=1 Tax=Halomicronema hongdechloris TaxID=1209493 RepID=UPI0009BAEA61
MQRRRLNAIRSLEAQRGSRVILMIHRRKSISLLGIISPCPIGIRPRLPASPVDEGIKRLRGAGLRHSYRM